MALPRLLQENGGALLQENGGYILLDGVSGSGAGTEAGATSSGSGTETIAASGSDAQASPTTAGSGSEVIAGSGSGVQAGATSMAPTVPEIFAASGDGDLTQGAATGTGSGRGIDAGDAAGDLVLGGQDLLPPNATPLEQQVAITWRMIQEIDPSVIGTIWNAWACPSSLLPFLAWALSVNIWNDAWDEVTKRQAIADSIPFHLVKGSRASVEQALATLTDDYSLTEWWETVPAAAPGTARVFIELGPTDDLQAIRQEAIRLVRNAKPKSRYVYAGVGSSAPGTLGISLAAGVSSTLTVQPYTVEMPEVDSTLYWGAVAVVSSVLTVNPSA